MNLKVVVHFIDLPGSMDIAEEIVDILISSNLINCADIFIYCNYDINSFAWLKDKMHIYNNVSLIDHKSSPIEFELSTLFEIKQLCDSTDEEFYVLYLHHKGASRIGTLKHSPISDWRNYMLYFNVEKWEECVKSLDEGYDTVGVEWIEKPTLPKHYSGNFWWATAKYIRSLPVIVRPTDSAHTGKSQFGFKQHYRLDAEMWIGLSNPKAKTLNNSNIDHYREAYSPHLYRKD